MEFPEPLRWQRKQQWLNHNEVLPGIYMIEDKASPRARQARVVFAKQGQISVWDGSTTYKKHGWVILAEITKPRYRGRKLYFRGGSPTVSVYHPSLEKLVELAIHIIKEFSL